MGSKLSVLAAVSLIIVCGLTRAATAQSPASALVKQGLASYKAGRYVDAASLLERAYELEPRPDTLFALAQSERLGGNCDKAIHHYKRLLESSLEPTRARAVQNNLDLCEATLAKLAPKPAPAPAPIVVQAPPRTIVREVRRSDRVAISLFAGGMLGLGGSAGMYFSARAAERDAATAATLAGHEQLLDRAERDRLIAYAAAGAGAALITVAIVRWVRGGNRDRPGVAIAPSTHGGTLTVAGAW